MKNGLLTASNQITFPNCFCGLKADIVATYKLSGFECDLVIHERPAIPSQIDASFATLQLVTEFFNTPDPQQIPAASDDWFGLQDSTLKFGTLTMTHGKAFAFQNSNTNAGPLVAPRPGKSAPVYKSWLHAQNRTFLVEQVPLADVAGELNALPLSASIQQTVTRPGVNGLVAPKPGNLLSFASRDPNFPPARRIMADTNQIQLATMDLKHEPGVVLDYNEFDASLTNFTFTGSTYCIGNAIYLGSNTTFQAGDNLGPNAYIFNGSMKHVALYTNALSASEIAANFLETEPHPNVDYPSLLYYKFTEYPGTEFTDSSLHGGTTGIYIDPDNGDIPWQSNQGGIPGAALHFHGPTNAHGYDSHIDTCDSTDFNFTTEPFTVNFWIYPQDDNENIFDNNRGDGSHGWTIKMNGAGDILFGNTSDAVVSATSSVTIGGWNMVTVVRGSSGQASIYINGRLNTSGTFGAINSSTDPLWIGGGIGYPGDSYINAFDGNLWGIQIWNEPLTAVDVENLYCNQITGYNWP